MKIASLLGGAVAVALGAPAYASSVAFDKGEVDAGGFVWTMLPRRSGRPPTTKI